MDFDFDCAAASPGGHWGGESASRRRQRRLSSPSLRAYLTPAFDAVAGGVPGSPASSYSSGGLELGFDASLLRYRRTCFSATADLDSRRLMYSPPQAQARPMYPVPDQEALLVEAYLNGPKRQAGGMTGAPGFPSMMKHQYSSPTLRPVDHRSPDGTVVPGNRVKLTPQPGATPYGMSTSAQAQPHPIKEEDDHLIAEVLYGHSGGRRLPIFKEICPE